MSIFFFARVEKSRSISTKSGGQRTYHSLCLTRPRSTLRYGGQGDRHTSTSHRGYRATGREAGRTHTAAVRPRWREGHAYRKLLGDQSRCRFSSGGGEGGGQGWLSHHVPRLTGYHGHQGAWSQVGGVCNGHHLYTDIQQNKLSILFTVVSVKVVNNDNKTVVHFHNC